ncbi:hypothetical protein GCM10027047_09420 [Rhodococcus aerolatus]
MGALSPVHWLILIAVLVILFGAKRLPDASRSLGRSMRIFKSEIKEMGQDGKDDAGTSAPAAQQPAPQQPVVQQLPPAAQPAPVTQPVPQPQPVAQQPAPQQPVVQQPVVQQPVAQQPVPQQVAPQQQPGTEYQATAAADGQKAS